MSKVFYLAEQSGNKVSFFDSTGTNDCLMADLEEFIERQQLNFETVEEPGKPPKEIKTISESSYLDLNWDDVTFAYWQENFNK